MGLPPSVNQAVGHEPVQDGAHDFLGVGPRGRGARPAAQTPAGVFAKEPPVGERPVFFGLFQLWAKAGKSGLLGCVPVGKLDGDGVPALSDLGLSVEGVLSCGLVDLDGIGEVADVHASAGGRLVERSAGQHLQDALSHWVRR